MDTCELKVLFGRCFPAWEDLVKRVEAVPDENAILVHMEKSDICARCYKFGFKDDVLFLDTVKGGR